MVTSVDSVYIVDIHAPSPCRASPSASPRTGQTQHRREPGSSAFRGWHKVTMITLNLSNSITLTPPSPGSTPRWGSATAPAPAEVAGTRGGAAPGPLPRPTWSSGAQPWAARWRYPCPGSVLHECRGWGADLIFSWIREQLWWWPGNRLFELHWDAPSHVMLLSLGI